MVWIEYFHNNPEQLYQIRNISIVSSTLYNQEQKLSSFSIVFSPKFGFKLCVMIVSVLSSLFALRGALYFK